MVVAADFPLLAEDPRETPQQVLPPVQVSTVVRIPDDALQDLQVLEAALGEYVFIRLK